MTEGQGWLALMILAVMSGRLFENAGEKVAAALYYFVIAGLFGALAGFWYFG